MSYQDDDGKSAARRVREQNIFMLAPLSYRLRDGFMAPEDAQTAEDQAFAKSHGLEPIQQELRYSLIHYRGIEVGDGWLPLVQELSEKMERVLQEMVANSVPVELLPGIVQVKEKFGSLSVGIRGFGDIGIPVAIKKIRDEADVQAATTCESCSAPGTLNATGYQSVLCKDCRA